MDDSMKQIRNQKYDYDKKYLKRKFYKCKMCNIAVYCSKHCQKVHWNLHDHKTECELLCMTIDYKTTQRLHHKSVSNLVKTAQENSSIDNNVMLNELITQMQKFHLIQHL